MSPFRELERELAHIKSAIALLEQTKGYFPVRTPISDPAYWRARLKAAMRHAAGNAAVEEQVERLLGRLERL